MTPAVLFFLPVLAGTAFEAPPKFHVDLCWSARMTVARAGFEVFLDPTEANRAAVTARLERDVLAPLQRVRDNTTKEPTAIWATTCRTFLSDRIRGIGHADFPYGGAERVEAPLGGADPRRWDPRAVARLVQQTREADSQTLENPGPNDGSWAEPGTPHAQLFVNLKTLSRLGAVRAFELVKPKYPGPVPGLNAPHEPPKKGMGYARAIGICGQHFPEEIWLYEQEWELAHPDLEDLLALPEPERGALLLQRDSYVNERWFETDRLAPHPDMEAVRKALDELGAGTRVPEKPERKDAPQ